MNLIQCAASYSLTETLQSVTFAVISASSTGSVLPSSAAASTTAKSAAATSSKATYVAPPTPTVVGTGGLTPTPTGAAQFTGAAAPKAGLGAVGGLVLAAGALLL